MFNVKLNGYSAGLWRIIAFIAIAVMAVAVMPVASAQETADTTLGDGASGTSVMEESTHDAESPASTSDSGLESDDGLGGADASMAPEEQPALAPRAAGTRADAYYVPQTPSSANPALPQKCGLNIALVFDLSNSIELNGRNGIAKSQKAANDVIDGLAGTPSSIGLFNFASQAPGIAAATQATPLSVLDQSGVEALKSKVSKLELPGGPLPGQPGFNQQRFNTRGGTNWEGALKQVADSGAQYDVVYFITDGFPTTDNVVTAGDYTQGVHQANLERAIAAANTLKNKGTRIVPLAVSMAGDDNPWIFHNDVEWDPGPSLVPVKGHYYFSRVNGVLKVFRYDGPNRWTNVTSTPSLWAYGRRLPRDMLNDISGQGDPIQIASFDQLAEQLKTQALQSCAGALNVIKTIVNADGSKKEMGKGWEFTATAGGNVLKSDSGSNVSTLARSTGDDGSVSYSIDSLDSQALTVRETAKQGFKVYQRDGKNAVCKEIKDGVQTSVSVTNDGADGFRVTVPKNGQGLGTVTCWVDNVEQPTLTPTIKKEPVKGTAVKVSPDGTAKLTYTISVVNPNANDTVTATAPKDIIRFPDGVAANGDATVKFTSTSGVTVNGGISSIAKSDLVRDREITLANSIQLQGGKTQVITLEIPVKVTDQSQATWDRLGTCDGDGGKVSEHGVPNSVKMEGDDDKPDNNACIPLLPPDKATMTINKVDKDNNNTPLGGATFTLYEAGTNGPDWNKPITVNGGGQSSQTLGSNLQPGTYYLVETQAPSGYTLLASPVPVKVVAHSNGYTLQLVNSSDSGLVTVSPTKEADASTALVVSVADVTSGKLPKTGGWGALPSTLVGFAIVLAGGLVARRKRGNA